ncbi:MAG TPA: DUF1622 domain-containing protein [Gemmatimonadaceae bacterium]
MTSIEAASQVINAGAEWLRLGLETMGAIAIAAGAIAALSQIARSAFGGERTSFTATRFTLARYLALALEFQLAGDVLETAIAPEWTKIGQLAAIATIRTALNFFLSRELQGERRELKPQEASASEAVP